MWTIATVPTLTASASGGREIPNPMSLSQPQVMLGSARGDRSLWIPNDKSDSAGEKAFLVTTEDLGRELCRSAWTTGPDWTAPCPPVPSEGDGGRDISACPKPSKDTDLALWGTEAYTAVGVGDGLAWDCAVFLNVFHLGTAELDGCCEGARELVPESADPVSEEGGRWDLVTGTDVQREERGATPTTGVSGWKTAGDDLWTGCGASEKVVPKAR